MRVEPNRRCSVQGFGSTVRADDQDKKKKRASSSASRFSMLLYLMRITFDYAIVLPLGSAFAIFPNSATLDPSNGVFALQNVLDLA